ncbi:hypothetical protein GCM10010182_40810 [Actinomadura cremea]|nr:hypothetical protein GCM10010182_40810 [Actinomadura cremea]
MSVPTREVTIYRYADTAPDEDALLETLVGTYLDESASSDIALPEYEGATALGFHWIREPAPVPWLDAVTTLIGPLPDKYRTRDCGALLILEVDGDKYAIGFGNGWRAIPDQFKDYGFGLGFVIRAVDADRVRTVVRRSMTGTGRQDATRVPSGIPIGHIGVTEYSELVRTLAGKVDPGELGLDRAKPVTVEGSAGLRLPIPLDRDGLVTVLRKISAICAREVQDEFAFVEAIRPVQDKWRRAALNEQLGTYLHTPLGAAVPEVRLAAAVPAELADKVDEAQSFAIVTGKGRRPLVVNELDLECVLAHCRKHGASAVQRLRRGRVHACSDAYGRQPIGDAPAVQWLEASTCLNGREYYLVEGDWYEGGAEYLSSVRKEIAALFRDRPGVVLPPWPKGLKPPLGKKERGETYYNERVETLLGADRFLNLDRELVNTSIPRLPQFEACDLLGPDDELVHVKSGKGSAPFSHLFTQALISAEALTLYPEARHAFAEDVQKKSGGLRSLPADWRPRKVVFAMRADRKAPLTAATLFPHAQIALARAARELRSQFNLDVEAVPIARPES